MLRLSWSLVLFFRWMLYLAVSLLADPKTAHLATRVQNTATKLRDASRRKHSASDAKFEAEGLRNAAWRRLCEVLYDFHRLSVVQYGKETDELRRLFPSAPSTLARLHDHDRRSVAFSRLLRVATEAPSPSPAYTEALSTLNAAWTEYVTAHQREVNAEATFAERREVERAYKQECIDVMSETAGALRMIYPRRAEKVRSFFPRKERPAKSSVAAVAPLPTAA